MLDTECNPPGAPGSPTHTAALRGCAQAEVKPPCSCVSRGAQNLEIVFLMTTYRTESRCP